MYQDRICENYNTVLQEMEGWSTLKQAPSACLYLVLEVPHEFLF